MITKEQKKQIIWLTAVAVVIVLGIIVYVVRHTSNGSVEQTLVVPPSTAMSSGQAPPQATSTPSKQQATSSGNTKAYEDALVKYKNQRMQFSGCQATPNNMTFKNPATLMLDNRSTTTDKIAIAGKTYYIAGLGYQIVTVSQSALPTHIYIDCNSSQNVATLLLEK